MCYSACGRSPSLFAATCVLSRAFTHISRLVTWTVPTTYCLLVSCCRRILLPSSSGGRVLDLATPCRSQAAFRGMTGQTAGFSGADLSPYLPHSAEWVGGTFSVLSSSAFAGGVKDCMAICNMANRNLVILAVGGSSAVRAATGSTRTRHYVPSGCCSSVDRFRLLPRACLPRALVLALRTAAGWRDTATACATCNARFCLNGGRGHARLTATTPTAATAAGSSHRAILRASIPALHHRTPARETRTTAGRLAPTYPAKFFLFSHYCSCSVSGRWLPLSGLDLRAGAMGTVLLFLVMALVIPLLSFLCRQRGICADPLSTRMLLCVLCYSTFGTSAFLFFSRLSRLRAFRHVVLPGCTWFLPPLSPAMYLPVLVPVQRCLYHSAFLYFACYTLRWRRCRAWRRHSSVLFGTLYRLLAFAVFLLLFRAFMPSACCYLLPL